MKLSNEMTALIKERQRQVKKKKNQIPYGIILIVISVALCIGIWQKQFMYAICWIMGVGIGVIIRYSRFCFASAFRDPFLVGNTKLLRGILLALMVSTVGFAVIQANYINQNVIDYNHIPGAVSSVGLHVMIGAFLFGVGMVIAGGCASGVLMRIGEGHALQWVVLLGFIIGTVLGAKDYSFWYDIIISKAKTIYFSEYIDLKIVVLGQISVLIGLYVWALWYEKRQWKDI